VTNGILNIIDVLAEAIAAITNQPILTCRSVFFFFFVTRVSSVSSICPVVGSDTIKKFMGLTNLIKPI
jgi:hypothetical protein